MSPSSSSESDQQAQDASSGAADTSDDKDSDHHGGTFLHLTVPPGIEAGVDLLTFFHDGTEVDVLVPVGSIAGDVLRIQVGADRCGGKSRAREEGTIHKETCKEININGSPLTLLCNSLLA